MEDFLKLELSGLAEISMKLIKFDGEIISNLKDCIIENLTVDLKETWSLDIKCPKYCLNKTTGENEFNVNYDLLEEEKFIELTFNKSKAKFVIKEVIEDSSSVYKKCKCYNSEKMINKQMAFRGVTKQLFANNTETGEGIFDIFNKSVLGWKLGHIDDKAMLEIDDTQGHNKYRYFDNVETNWHDFIRKEVADSYEILPIFDSYKGLVNIYDINTYGKNTGFVISDKNIAKKIEQNSNTKDIITKLHMTGKEDINLIGVNPLGTYVQNYDYFKPLMSEKLKDSLDNYDIQLEKLFLKWQIMNEELFQLQVILQEKTEERIKKDETIKLLKTRQAVALKEDNKEELASVKILLDKEISSLTLILNKIKDLSSQIKVKTDSMIALSESMKVENVIDDNGIKIFDYKTLLELNDYTKEASENKETFFTKHALYSYAKKRIKEVSKPKILINMDANNFIDDIYNYDGYDNYITLGDKYYILDSKGNKVEVTFINYSYKPKDKSLSFTFSSEGLKVQENTQSFSGIANTVNKNNKEFSSKKWEWTEDKMQKDFVKDLLQNGLDVGLTNIFAESNKNKISIDENGIWLQNIDNPDMMIVQTASTIIISDDGLKTAKTAIDATGIYAELLVGKIIAGQKLYISNANNDFRIDENGIFVDAKKLQMKFTDGIGDIETKFKVTADGFEKSITDTKLGLKNEIKETAEGTTQLVSDTKLGLQNEIKTSATGTTQLITDTKLGLQNEIKMSADGLNLKIDNTEKALSAGIVVNAEAIKGTVKAGDVQSIVTQNAGSIISEFSKTGEVIIKNGNFSIEHIDGGKMFWVQGGRIKGAAIDLSDLGDTLLNIFGVNEKGISIRSTNDREVYIDFARKVGSISDARISMTRNNMLSYVCPNHYFASTSGFTKMTVQGDIYSENKIYATDRIEGDSFHSRSGYITANSNFSFTDPTKGILRSIYADIISGKTLKSETGYITTDKSAFWFTDPSTNQLKDINVQSAICHGNKPALVDTKSYGKTFMYAEESTMVLFSDYGEGVIGNDGLCYIYIDPQFSEAISTKQADYRIQLTGWSGCNAEINKRESDYFVVSGVPNKRFEWKVIGERKGYERMRFNEAMEANNIIA